MSYNKRCNKCNRIKNKKGICIFCRNRKEEAKQQTLSFEGVKIEN